MGFFPNTCQIGVGHCPVTEHACPALPVLPARARETVFLVAEGYKRLHPPWMQASFERNRMSLRYAKCSFYPRLSIKKILLVDDDPVFVRGASALLRTEGFDVLTAEDGASTLSAISESKFDLILLDICFRTGVEDGGSAWDGFEIMDWLRYTGDVDNIPVILLTAAEQTKYGELARRAGAAGFFQKTFKTAELLKLIHQLLD
jgi:CheY-like chemotaxis protein